MGSKRVGLARTQALIENLKRSLDLNAATLTDVVIRTAQGCNFSGDLTAEGQLFGIDILHDPCIVGATPTALPVSGSTLDVNTFYNCTGSKETGITIPLPSAGAKGDFITIFYSANIDNGVEHTYALHSSDTQFSVGSTLTRVGGAITSAADISVANDDVLLITGATNGDGGAGSVVQLVNRTGAAGGWAVKVVILNRGNGSSASAATGFRI